MNARHMSTGQASQTALLIARTVAILPYHPEDSQQVDLQTAQLSESLCHNLRRNGDPLLKLLHLSLLRKLLFWLESKIVPGLFAHYGIRKRHLKAMAQERLSQGCNQLIILGAGLDSLGLELTLQKSRLQCVEMDFPTTLEAKGKALRRFWQDTGQTDPGLQLACADLNAGRLSEILATTSIDPNKAVFIVAEGLFMYLPEKRMKEILSFLAGHFKAELTVAFTFLEQDTQGRPVFVRPSGASRLMDAILKRMGEPFQWGLEPTAMAQFLSTSGFQIEKLLQPAAPTMAEWICLCSRNR